MSRFDAILARKYPPSPVPSQIREPEILTDSVTKVTNLSPPTVEILPFLTASGELIILRDSPRRYHYWRAGGQTLRETLEELNASQTVRERYVNLTV